MGEQVIFIADAHLQPGKRPEAEKALAVFLRQATQEAQRLVLLGDTFHLWFERRGEAIGDYSRVLSLFGEAASAGLRIDLVCGNRDFAMGAGKGGDAYPGFFSPLGDRTPSVLTHYGIEPRGDYLRWRHDDGEIFACHGDIFCRRLYSYRILRWLLRSYLCRFCLWHGPMRLAKFLGGILQNRRRAGLPDPPTTPCILTEAVAPLIASGIDLVICGHVHMHERRAIAAGERHGELFIVPAWSYQGEYATLSAGRIGLGCINQFRS